MRSSIIVNILLTFFTAALEFRLTRVSFSSFRFATFKTTAIVLYSIALFKQSYDAINCFYHRVAQYATARNNKQCAR